MNVTYKKFILVTTFLLVLFYFSMSVYAVDHTVSGTSFNNVQSSLDGSNPNDSILVGDKTYTPGSVKTINVNIDNITIKGQSSSFKAVFNAQGSDSRVLIIRGDNVRLENMIFINADVDYIGSVLHSSGANLTIINCEFSNNRGYSGPIVLENSSVNAIIQNCIFNNNTASPSTSVTGAAGAIDFHSSNTRIINCIFKNNYASKGGGALYFIIGGNNSVINCNFVNNSAPLGGAIWFSTDW